MEYSGRVYDLIEELLLFGSADLRALPLAFEGLLADRTPPVLGLPYAVLLLPILGPTYLLTTVPPPA